jgi:hypothetical protein
MAIKTRWGGDHKSAVAKTSIHHNWRVGIASGRFEGGVTLHDLIERETEGS